MMRLPLSRRGFTLLEGLIAAALLAVIGTALAGSVSTSIDSKERVEDISGRYHVVRQGISRMVDEISMAYLSKHIVNNELRVRTGFKGERDSLQFTAFGHVPRVVDAKESDQREIGYSLGFDDRSGTESILRRVQPNPDLEIDEGGRTQTLLPNVSNLEFEYWDPTSEDWKDSWDTEESTYQNRLPTRVKITVTAAMSEDEPQTFITQSKIWLIIPQTFSN